MSAPVLTAKTPVQAPGSITSDRHANPLLAAPTKKENFGWAAVLSIFSVVLFLVLLAMQWMEYDIIRYI